MKNKFLIKSYYDANHSQLVLKILSCEGNYFHQKLELVGRTNNLYSL